MVFFLLGHVKNINGMTIAKVCNKLGAGRQFSDQKIDPTVGVYLFVKIGDIIERDTLCMILHHNEVVLDKSLLALLQNSIELTNEVVEPINILIDVIDYNSL